MWDTPECRSLGGGRPRTPCWDVEEAGAVAFCLSEPSVHPGYRSVGRAEELLQTVITEFPREIPQPEHVLEELDHRVPLWWVVAAPA